MFDVCEIYGIKPLTVEEEWNQPENAKRTRLNKMKGLDTTHHMKALIETLEIRLRAAPELDDKAHADLVEKLVNKVDDAYRDIFEAVNVGRM